MIHWAVDPSTGKVRCAFLGGPIRNGSDACFIFAAAAMQPKKLKDALHHRPLPVPPLSRIGDDAPNRQVR